MSDDLSARLQLLRDLYERVRSKEETPALMFAEAGVKDKARLKDIEKEITQTRKKVSLGLKKAAALREEQRLEKIAVSENITVAELRERAEKEKDIVDLTGIKKSGKDGRDLAVARARDRKATARSAALGDDDDMGIVAD